VRRRSLIAAAGAMVLPASARAQTPPLVGVLRFNPRRVETFAGIFERDMARLGWEDGKDYRAEFLFADGDPSRLPALAADLVARQPRVIAVFGNTAVAAVQQATREIPIVGMADDLVAVGLVSSMARPDGNTTGVSIMAFELDGKRLEVLHEMVLAAHRIGIVSDPASASKGAIDRVEQAAGKLGLTLSVVRIEKPDDVAPGLAALAAARVEAVQMLASPFLNAQRGVFIERLQAMRLPAMYEWPETVEEGGLACYGPRQSLVFRHVAVLIDKVLRGARVADLPVEQPTTFTLALNAAAARAIGLQLPSALLLRADLVVD
jgi:putative tryptophan/tyrosine transport system substrate-binding protein